MAGILLASFAVFMLGSYNFIDPGWRFLYLFGCITALFGCLFRRSPSSTKQPIKFSDDFAKLKNTLWTYRKALFYIAICSGFSSACYSMALVLMNGLIPLISTITKAEIMKINTYLLVFDFCLLPIFGWIASKLPREQLMLAASLCVAVLSIPLFVSLEGASLIGIIAIRVVLIIFGVAFCAPFNAWAAQLVPQDARYTVTSLGYALGCQLLGGPTAALALWSFQKTGMVASVAWYWMFLGILSSGAILLTLRAKHVQLLKNA
jgi:MHS family proline/betaine transporter-like MFS transporter